MTLSYMNPNSAMIYRAYSALSYRKLNRKLLLRLGFVFKTFSYVQNIFFSNFCIYTIATPWRSISSFIYHIFDVIKLRPNYKMMWINAFRIVTFMKYAHSFWYFSKVNYPRSSMCLHKLSIFKYFPISITIATSCPIPAFVFRGFRNFIPKSIFKHLNMVSHKGNKYNG